MCSDALTAAHQQQQLCNMSNRQPRETTVLDNTHSGYTQRSLDYGTFLLFWTVCVPGLNSEQTIPSRAITITLAIYFAYSYLAYASLIYPRPILLMGLNVNIINTKIEFLVNGIGTFLSLVLVVRAAYDKDFAVDYEDYAEPIIIDGNLYYASWFCLFICLLICSKIAKDIFIVNRMGNSGIGEDRIRLWSVLLIGNVVTVLSGCIIFKEECLSVSNSNQALSKHFCSKSEIVIAMGSICSFITAGTLLTKCDMGRGEIFPVIAERSLAFFVLLLSTFGVIAGTSVGGKELLMH